jgi:hypothetical protein
LLLLRTAAKRREEGVNATVLPEKQEVRRNPNADDDGFIISTCNNSVDNVSVFILSCVVIYEPRYAIGRVIVNISKEEFFEWEVAEWTDGGAKIVNP